jgi:hypothetical protein
MISDAIGIEFFYNNFWQYWGGMLYLVLYLGCLLYLGRYGSKWMKQIFVWPFLFLLLTAYNPLIMGPILSLTGWEDRYCRFFWVLPVEILCAYLLAVLIERQKSGGAKTAVILLGICMVLVCGNKTIPEIPDENIYKMDDYILEMSELIDEEKSTEQPIVMFDPNVYYQIRQYNPTLLAALNNVEMCIYTEQSAEEIDKEEQYVSDGNLGSMFVRGVEVDAEQINRLFRERNVEFFVRNKDYYSDEYLQSLALSYVGEVKGYEVYRCTHE